MNVNSEVNNSIREKNIADRNESVRFGEATEERQLKRNEEGEKKDNNNLCMGKIETADTVRGIYRNKQISK